MLRHHEASFICAAALAVLSVCGPALAHEPEGEGIAQSSAKPKALSEDELSLLSGGKETVPSIAAITTGSNSGNSIVANSVTAGDITMEPGALNFSGIGNFVLNTGQNNNLQGVLNVNISITPAL